VIENEQVSDIEKPLASPIAEFWESVENFDEIATNVHPAPGFSDLSGKFFVCAETVAD
jgi:hypothetical protein